MPNTRCPLVWPQAPQWPHRTADSVAAVSDARARVPASARGGEPGSCPVAVTAYPGAERVRSGRGLGLGLAEACAEPYRQHRAHDRSGGQA